MTDKFYSAVGIARRAGKLCIGHDEVKNSVKKGKARLIIFTFDSSPRLKAEFARLTDSVKTVITDASMEDMASRIGRRSGVFSVTDGEIKDLILSTIKEDSIYGANQ